MLNLKKTICDHLNYCPKWLTIYIEIENLKNKNNSLNSRLIKFEKKPYQLLQTNYPTVSKGFLLRLILVPATFGLSFIGYLTKNKARQNQLLNEKNAAPNEENIKNTDAENMIRDADNKLQNKPLLDEISSNKLKIKQLEKDIENITVSRDEDNWISLKEAFNFDLKDELDNKKGVYIIWNKTLDKYYVGQSKNLFKRIFTQHFNKGDVKNIIFAKDWYNNDEFKFKYEFVETKDELDQLEKYYIEYYNTFINGYNGTGGNA